MTTQEKIAELTKIADEIKAFKGLEIARTAHNPVPGEGNPDSPLLFIGEAPGAQEDATGRPFVGQSGQFMAKTLTETTGLTRDQVFITNIVKYRPPENRDPTPEEIAACRDWLDRQIASISPRYIVTLGRFSMGKFIDGVTISRVHGQPRKCKLEFGSWNLECIVFPMFHPAAALRAGEVMRQFKEDFNKLNDLLVRAIHESPPTPSSADHSQKAHPAQTSLFLIV